MSTYTAPMIPVTFIAGATGRWRIERSTAICGAALPTAARLERAEGNVGAPLDGAAWMLRGVTSQLRYTAAAEQSALDAIQPGLDRPTARRAALIPIRKSARWWALAQDERRAIFEETSHHIQLGLDYLPAVARRLYHSRELGETFDFLSWLEFSAADSDAFDTLLARLRMTTEWQFVEHEVELRLSLD